MATKAFHTLSKFISFECHDLELPSPSRPSHSGLVYMLRSLQYFMRPPINCTKKMPRTKRRTTAMPSVTDMGLTEETSVPTKSLTPRARAMMRNGLNVRSRKRARRRNAVCPLVPLLPVVLRQFLWSVCSVGRSKEYMFVMFFCLSMFDFYVF